jgi:hypothetical protein
MRTYMATNDLVVTNIFTGRGVHEAMLFCSYQRCRWPVDPGDEDTNAFLHIHNLNRDTSIWGEDGTEWKPERICLLCVCRGCSISDHSCVSIHGVEGRGSLEIWWPFSPSGKESVKPFSSKLPIIVSRVYEKRVSTMPH